jgi:hypothetical protein
VFDQFGSRGVASQALEQFIVKNTRWPLMGIIRNDNETKAKVVSILKRAGFQEEPLTGNTVFILTAPP